MKSCGAGQSLGSGFMAMIRGRDRQIILESIHTGAGKKA